MKILFNFEEELAKYGLTKESYEAVCKEIEMKLNGFSDVDWTEIKDKYNILCAADTIRKSSSTIFGGQFRTEYLKSRSISENITDIEKAQNTYKSESSINKDGTLSSDKLIVIKEDELKNPNSLLKAHGFDIRDWELVSARNNIWNVYSKQDGIQELYSSKIVVKPRSEISIEEIRDFYKGLIDDYSSPTVSEYKKNSGKLMLEVPIFDLHLGKYSTSDIVTDNYNTEIARECFNKVIDDVIHRCKGMDIEKILFPIGNDLFHFDSVGSMTTGGTPQDTDMKHQTLFKTGVLLLIDGINKLSKELNTNVDVFCVNGNHDFLTSYHALMSLWCFFNNNENVTVDLGTSPRKYREFGKVLLGFTHGDKEGKRIFGLMQTEADELWGKVNGQYREWHLGHLHSEQVKEENGIIVRNLPSVTGTDAWHHNQGYIGAIRRCTCFLWDKDNGLDSTFNVFM